MIASASALVAVRGLAALCIDDVLVFSQVWLLFVEEMIWSVEFEATGCGRVSSVQVNLLFVPAVVVSEVAVAVAVEGQVGESVSLLVLVTSVMLSNKQKNVTLCYQVQNYSFR